MNMKREKVIWVNGHSAVEPVHYVDKAYGSKYNMYLDLYSN